MATQSSILAWKIPWTEEPGRLQSMGSQRVGHNWETSLHSLHSHHTLSLEKEMETWSSILAWKIPWTEELRGQQSMGSQRVRHIWGHTYARMAHITPSAVTTRYHFYLYLKIEKVIFPHQDALYSFPKHPIFISYIHSTFHVKVLWYYTSPIFLLHP